MKRNNLFMYATSELSQDAFICWLMNFAHPDHLAEDPVLTDCAKKLLSMIIKTNEDFVVTSIQKQYKNIDILLQVNDKYNIIIEDKTFTNHYDEQKERYQKTLETEGRNNIIVVYYKIVEQYYNDKTDAVIITRTDILRIFDQYIEKTNNHIFKDYFEYLLSIEEEVNSYKTSPIGEWNHAYKGFFTHLINDNIIEKNRHYGWDYVANRSGGFMALWWFFLGGKELGACNLNEHYIKDLYLQIENNVIAVKMTSKSDKSIELRWSLYNYFKSKAPDFFKKTFRQGEYMTVGCLEYNEKNYHDRIKLMQDVMQSIAAGAYKFCTEGSGTTIYN